LIARRTLGPGFWATVAYCYALAAVTTVLLVQAVIRFTGLYRAQAAVMLFGVLLPWTVDILDTIGIWGFIPVDLVSMSFAVTGLTFLPGLLRLRLLDLTPMAWAAVVKLMNDPVVALDSTARIVVVNPAAKRLLNRPDLEFLGAEAADIFRDWGELGGRLERIGEHDESVFEIERPGPAQDYAIYSASLSRLEGQSDYASAGWVLVLRDVTDLRRAERERLSMISEQSARAEAEAANQAKDRFLATLSHELRTPLTPVLVTVTAMLDDRSTPGFFRPVLEMIRRNIDLEARLIEDLVDLTRIKRGQLDLRRESLDAHEQIDRALGICASDIQTANLTIVKQLDAEAHFIDADPGRFQQVLWNLFQSAIKFRPQGRSVTIRSLNRCDSKNESDTNWLVVEIIEVGLEIDPGPLPQISTPFVPGGPVNGRKASGLGLGLSVSSSIIEEHGGRLSASFEEGERGVALSLELPTVGSPIIDDTPLPTTPGSFSEDRPLRILLVEDNKDILGYLSAMLGKRGHMVYPAHNVASALRLSAEIEIELLISDIELPDGSGLDLLSRLRVQRPVAGIALSGFGSAEDIENSLSVGFAEHLTKPIDFRRLEEVIQQVATAGETEGVPRG
jgi:signal transduction histidine kinase/ActR/RegA family two-component response regulator